MDPGTGKFKFNDHVIDLFKDFCAIFSDSYQEAVIKQALRTLVELNLIMNFKRGNYVVNPLISGGKRLDNKRGLINDYSNLLIKKKRDTVLDYFPIYSKRGKRKVEKGRIPPTGPDTLI